VLIAEEFLLLCLDDQTGKSTLGVSIEPALGGAVLVELALLERVGVRHGDNPDRPELFVIDSSPTDDPVLDDALRYLLENEGVNVYDIVNAFSSSPITEGLRGRLLVRLADGGVLTHERSKILGVFPTTTWPTADPGAEDEVRLRLGRALLDGEAPTERTAALVGLLQATSHLEHVVATDDRSALVARAATITEGDWAAEAVKHALDELMLIYLMLL
jgi:hypothetical protein